MSTIVSALYLRVGLNLIVAFVCALVMPTSSAFSQEALPADVRLVIDVSGSMKRNDPANLRQPAVELLVQLLPDGSRAGVWTFGKWVNMLVPHRDVDATWRQQAQQSSAAINSVGLFTNIGAALEKAAYDIDTLNDQYRSSIILLTDGMVDIEKDPQANQQEWRRIIDDVLPKLKQAGITVHTVALSDNADRNLLNRLSLATDGIAEVALTADDLMQVFLKAFDVAAPSEQVPLNNNRFLVDSSVEEFTALIFRAEPAEQIALIGPDKARYSAQDYDKDAKWHRADSYDLITIKRPLEGEWLVEGEMDPESRITVVSNLNLRVAPLPNNVFLGQELELAANLQEDGNAVTAPDFLSLMQVDVAMEAGNDEFSLQQFWTKNLSQDGIPQQGVYRVKLPAFDKDGIYQLNLTIDGKSFVREYSQQFTVRQAFGAEIKQEFSKGNMEYVLTVYAYDSSVDYAKTKVVATVTGPDDRAKIRPLELADNDSWRVPIRPQKEGEYQALVRIKGEGADGEKIDITLNEVSFNFSLDGGFVEEQAPFFPDKQDEPAAEKSDLDKEAEPKNAKPQAEVDDENDNVNKQEVKPSAQTRIPSWALYAALGLGNILLFSLGFFGYKKLMSGPKDDELLAEFDEPAQEPEEETDAAATEPEEEEPPMEDLDPIDDGVDEEPAPDDGDDDMFSMMEETQEGDAAAPEAFTEDAIEDVADMMADFGGVDESEEMASMPMPDEPDASMDEDVLPSMEDMSLPDEGTAAIDDLDDLDAMAIDAQEQQVQENEPAEDDVEEEDMVAAMLKAQGLDLADEELDDAISSLIDELGGDDEQDKS